MYFKINAIATIGLIMVELYSRDCGGSVVVILLVVTAWISCSVLPLIEWKMKD